MGILLWPGLVFALSCSWAIHDDGIAHVLTPTPRMG